MKGLLVAFVVAMGFCATGVMADEGPVKAQEETPKKKHRKKKVHKAHKFHADHKVAAVEEPPPPPAPTPEPPPPPAPEPPPPAVAVVEKDDSGFYAGIGAGSFTLDVTGINVNTRGANIRMKGSEFGGYGNVGYNFNRNIAVELRAGGVERVDAVFEGGPILGTANSVPFRFIANTDAFYSAFLKGTVPVGETFEVFGLVGATHYVVDLAANIGPLLYRADFNDSDVSYGGGVQARLTDTFVLGAEYVKYVDTRDRGVAADLDGVAGRLQFNF